MIESELPVCKIMFNVHVQCIIACHITCVLSLPLPPSLPPSLPLSPYLPTSLPLPFFGFARSRQVKSPFICY